jgi:hypothetical protein
MGGNNMKKRTKLLIVLGVLIVIVVLLGCIYFVHRAANQPEPASSLSTEGYTFTISGIRVTAANEAGSNVIFQGETNGSTLSGVVSPDKVYVLSDDVLYSMDADGGNRYKVASKCYNPGGLAHTVVTDASQQLGTLGYYHGYVYFITYGSESKLMRFACGTSQITELSRNTVSAFTISQDGILTGYSETDNLGAREITAEIDLNTLSDQ